MNRFLPDYLKKILSFFNRKTKLELLGLFLLMLLGAFLDMVGIALVLPLLQMVAMPDKLALTPLVGSLLVASGIVGKPWALPVLGGSLLVFYAVKNTVLAGLVWVITHTVNVNLTAFMEHLLRTYLRRPYLDHIQQNSAIIMRNVMFSSVEVINNGLLSSLGIAMESLLLVGALSVLFAVEPGGALVAGGLLGGGMLTLFWVTRHRISRWGGTLNQLNAEMIQAVNEVTAAFKEIKLRGCENIVIASFAEPNYRTVGPSTRLTFVTQIPRLAGEIIILSSIAGVVFYLTAIRGQSFGEMVPVLGVFAAASLRILPSINRVTVYAQQIRRSLAAVDALYRDYHSILGQREVLGDGTPISLNREVRIENIAFRYPSADHAALENLSLTINRNETVAFVGASGSGKSTLADIILGLLVPTNGRILVDGADIREHLRSWQDHIGYVPQHIVLADTTLRRNIAFGIPDAEIDDARIATVAEVAQISAFIGKLPKGLDTVVGEHGIRLSGGQRQRIGIARALYHDPEFLVFDEATSALDNLTEEEFVQALEALHGSKTIIVIAHRLTTVKKCDRLFFLSGGKVLDSGTFDELVARSPDFRQVMLAETGG